MGNDIRNQHGCRQSARTLSALARAARRAISLHTLAARVLSLGLASCTGLAIFSAAGCANNDPVFDPRAMESIERDNASAYATPPRPISSTSEDLPSTRKSHPTTIPSGGLAGSDSPIVRMSLREVIQRAVANSADVRVAGYDPAINAQKVIQQQAVFDPTFVSNISVQRTDSQTAGLQVVPGSLNNTPLFTNKQTIDTYQGGLQQTTPSGAKLQALWSTDETDSNPPVLPKTINPYWENQVELQVTQPILKGFGPDVNSSKITIAKDDQRISTLEFRKTLEETVDQIEQDYWQLYDAEQEVLFDQQLVQTSLATFDFLNERMKHGDAEGGIPAAQAETRVKADQAVLLAAQARVRDVSEDLKRRMNDPAFPVAAPVVILPGDTPIQVPIEFELKSQIETALDNRLELGEQRERIDEANILLAAARNGELPQLDLVANMAVQGLAKVWSSALKNQGEFNHISYTVGLQFSYPIGNRAAKAATRQAQLQRLQAIEQYRSLIDQVSLDVEVNWDGVYSSYKQAERRQQSRLAAEHQLQLINNQIQKGAVALSPPFVQVQLQAQEDLANAQREEAISLANYNIAIEKLEKAKGTLLKYDNVIMQEDPVITPDNGTRRRGHIEQ